MRADEASPIENIGRYTVIRLIGQGAMGRVFLAHDSVLDRHVAIKLLRDDLGLPHEHLETLYDRMRQEARASARVSHPHIVTLFDMGEDDNLGLFLVFEHVEGLTLKQRVQRGPLGPELVRKLALELGSALSLAHEAGVLHRDIKPENVMLAPTGSKIADFGIARVPDSTLTRDGRLLGTPAYSAPEAISHGTFSPASDQFSLATTLYEALCLHRAFPGDDAVAVAARITYEEPPAIAALCGFDPRVDTVLARALSKNPRARFQTCELFGQALAESLDLPGRRSMPSLSEFRTTGGATHPVTRRSAAALLAAAVAGGIIVLFMHQFLQGYQSDPRISQADAGEYGSSLARDTNSAVSRVGNHRKPNTRMQNYVERQPLTEPPNAPIQPRATIDAGDSQHGAP